MSGDIVYNIWADPSAAVELDRLNAEIKRLRAAGDALATNLQQMEDLYHSRTCKGMNTERIDNCTCLLALAAWEEARS